MTPSSEQSLTIVLLCSGNGSDSSNYRPSRDDVRYRNRHDALVRCVASSLYGPAGTAGTCEVILLYDGDLACMRMSLSQSSGSRFPPTPLERNVVTSWKDAAKFAVRYRQQRKSVESKLWKSGLRMNDTVNYPSKSPSYFAPSSTVGNLRVVKKRIYDECTTPENPIVEKVHQLKTICDLEVWKAVESIRSSSKRHEDDSNVRRANGAPALGKQASFEKNLPLHMPSSKRDIISALQCTCSVEYLRQHHLNVTLDVALRKVNKSTLRRAWEGYVKYSFENDPTSTGSDSKRVINGILKEGPCIGYCDDSEVMMERTFRSILSQVKQRNVTKTDGSHKVNNFHTDFIAAHLHESCDSELPCWGWDELQRVKKNGIRHIFLFLGAVRDMSVTENDALSRACKNLGIPLVPCRLGPVPEFTSKIVSVAGFHHAQGVLGNALLQLWESKLSKNKTSSSLPKRGKIDRNLPLPCYSNGLRLSRTIHTIALVPMASNSLVTDPDKRDRIHWCMVRMCVCSLWRSKLASSSDSNAGDQSLLNNLLTFIFQDGSSITLKQREFTSLMADNHKAAPSEFQILQELCRQRDSGTSDFDHSKKSSSLDNTHQIELHYDDMMRQTCQDVVAAHIQSTVGMKLFLLNFTEQDHQSNHSTNLFDMSYSKKLFQDSCGNDHVNETHSYTLFTIVGIRTGCNSKTKISKRLEQAREIICAAFRSAGVVPITQPSFAGETASQEEESLQITMLQHLDYQSRLYQLLKKLEILDLRVQSFPG